MGRVPFRHNALFDALTLDPARADRLIRYYLGNIAIGLSETPAIVHRESFLSRLMRTTAVDRLVEFRRRDDSRAYVYALLEHKSTVDFGTPLQIMGYVHSIWVWHFQRPDSDRRVLPPIIPLVFYHGAAAWSVPQSVLEMIDGSDPFAEFARSMAYKVFELGTIPFEELSPDPDTRAALGLLKHSPGRVLPDREGSLILRDIDSLPLDSEYLHQILTYIGDVFELTPVDLEKLISGRESQAREYMMSTLAEYWTRQGEAKGEAKGEARGEAKGRADVLLRQLEHRFGAVPTAVAAQVRAAAIGDLDSWLDAVLDAPDLDGVFRSRPLH